MKSFFSFALAAIAVSGLLAAPACRQQPQSRQYEENGATVAPASSRPQPRLPAGTWCWEKPRPWREEGSSGLRLATFSFSDREKSGLCTLVPLSGDGGGVQANVQRWLAQLNLPQFSQPELAVFLKRQKTMQTGSGLPVTIIDLTTLGQTPEQSGASMMVAMISAENQTLFVKISGEKALLEKNRDVFLKFCRSLSQGA
jgi:hypothetical protein